MNGSNGPRRVVKVGGSLFDLPMRADDSKAVFEDSAWLENVERWIRAQPSAMTILVVGGGQPIRDVLSDQCRTGFDDAEAHWRCIRIMGDHARLLSERAPLWKLVEDPRELDGVDVGATFVLEADAFMEAVDASLGPRSLPESWDVSSDSIAARAAELFAADELVLLKSTLPRDVNELGDYVDRYFMEATRSLPHIRFVTLRDPGFPEVRWR